MPRVLRTHRIRRATTSAPKARTSSIATARVPRLPLGFRRVRARSLPSRDRQALRDAMELDLPNLVQMECPPLSGLLAEALVARMPNDGLSLLLHEQRRRVGRDGAQVRALRHQARPHPVRRSRVPRAHDGRIVAQRRARVPRPLRHAPARLPRAFRSATSTPSNASSRRRCRRVRRRADSGQGRVRRARGLSARPAELCHRYGALLAIDEVQTGLGRTGTFFAFEQWDVEPDLVTVAKALSGGYVPVGAVIATSGSSSGSSTRWTAPSCTARPSGRTSSR